MQTTLWGRLRYFLIGPAKDIYDPQVAHKLSLVAFLAWVGLGADGLSSSAYGPEEAFKQLGNHTYLALPLVVAMAATVFIISYSYSRIIEHFPVGGGGYMVATQLLGKSAGVVSGCALLVDYVLTITVSIAAGGDALFSLLPLPFHPYKLPIEYLAILFLILLNLRGVKESILLLVPLFLTFIATHILLIGGGVVSNFLNLPRVVEGVQIGLQGGIAQVGGLGLFFIFLRAYALGGGTYTGIEAVSNGIGIFREPKVTTGKRTMLYMAVSLAVTAAGLLFCFMLTDVRPMEGETLNATLGYRLAGDLTLFGIPVGNAFVVVLMFSEAILLLVASQTGFIGGPRVMANMATDSWLPRRFAVLSDRLSMQNGVLLMGVASLLLLVYTQGSVQTLVVMYSVNVFLTFSLSQMGMVRFWIKSSGSQPAWKREILIQAIGLILSFSILTVMIFEKLEQGAWITVMITGVSILLCFAIRNHYRKVAVLIREVDKIFEDIPPEELLPKKALPFDPKEPTAVILVNGYTGLGIHIFLTVFRLFRETFKNVVFVSVGVIDSAMFKTGGHYVEELEEETKKALERYIHLANDLGIAAETAYRIGTDVADEASDLCIELSKKYERPTFFAGEIVFRQFQWYHRFLHNFTPYAIQRRLRSAGLTLMILPMLDEKLKKAA